MKMLSYAKYQYLSLQYYRVNALFVILSSVSLALVQFNLWQFVERKETLSVDMKSYALYAILLNLLLVTNSTVAFISDKVLKGNIAQWLMHPYSLMTINFNIQLGTLLYKLIYQFGPILIIFILFFNWQLPQVTFMLMISLILSFILSFIIGYILAILSTVIINIRGILNLYTVCLTIFGGAMISIDLYPEWLRTLCFYTPFYYITYVPLKLMTESDNMISLKLIVMQLCWLIFFVGVLIFVWRRLRHKMTIMGG